MKFIQIDIRKDKPKIWLMKDKTKTKNIGRCHIFTPDYVYSFDFFENSLKQEKR